MGNYRNVGSRSLMKRCGAGGGRGAEPGRAAVAGSEPYVPMPRAASRRVGSATRATLRRGSLPAINPSREDTGQCPRRAGSGFGRARLGRALGRPEPRDQEPEPLQVANHQPPRHLIRTNRRWSGWTGRAFIGYRAAKASTCACATAIASVITTQLTTSEQGGVVREPAYRK